MMCGPRGSHSRAAAAIANMITHQPFTTAELRSPTAAPIISISIAPHASTSSGSNGNRSCKAGNWVMARLLRHERGRFGRGYGVIVILEQLGHRSGRHIQHWLGRNTEQDGEHDQRREDHAFAPADVADRSEE